MPDQLGSFERAGYGVSLYPEAKFAASAVAAKWHFCIYRAGEIDPIKRGISNSKEAAESAACEWIDAQRKERSRSGADRRAGADRRQVGNDRRVNPPDGRSHVLKARVHKRGSRSRFAPASRRRVTSAADWGP